MAGMIRTICLAVLLSVCGCGGVATNPIATPAKGDAAFRENFEAESGWSLTGDAAVVANESFVGRQSLRLHRAGDEPASALGPEFPVSAGTYEVQLGLRTELESPGSAVVGLRLTYPWGRVSDGPILVEQAGLRGWRQVRKRIVIPADYTSAHVYFEIRHATGSAWLDDITVRRVGG